MKTLNTRLWQDGPVPVPDSVPEPVPAQDEPKPRTKRRAKRATSRTAKKEARTAERAKDKEARTTRRTAERATKASRPSRSTKLRNKLEKKLQEKASEPATLTPDARAGLMGVSRRGALVAITVLDLLATAVSFGESWDALYRWATGHGLSGFWAFVFPLQIDTFIAMGELALFIAILDHWNPQTRIWAWVSTFGGLAVSMVGNVGHVHGHPGSWQATAAVPPLAAMAGMFIGFQVLKRVMNPTKAATVDQAHLDLISQLRTQVEELSHVPAPRPEPEPQPEPEPAYVPAQRPPLEPGQFFTGDRPEPATAVQVGVFQDGSPAFTSLLPDMVRRAPIVGDPASGTAAFDVTDLEHIADDGAPLRQIPRTSMGQDKPEIVKERPAAKSEPKPQPVPRRKRGGKHPKWDEGVKAYRESGATKDERMSQRELAAALGMQNRSLAARIIDHVENGGE
jgi:hypothetical protein